MMIRELKGDESEFFESTEVKKFISKWNMSGYFSLKFNVTIHYTISFINRKSLNNSLKYLNRFKRKLFKENKLVNYKKELIKHGK